MSGRFGDSLMAGISVLAAFVLLELYLRVDDRRPTPSFATVTLSGSEFELFDHPAKLAQLENAIVFFGDSFTEGAACGRDRNFPARFGELARELDSELRTINVGREGTNTWSYLRKAQAVLAQTPPPRGAVVTLSVNDVEYDCALCYYLNELKAGSRITQDEVAILDGLCTRCAGRFSDVVAHHSPLRRLHRWLFRYSYVYRLARDAAYQSAALLNLRVGWGMKYPEYWAARDGIHYKLVEASLEMLADDFRRAEVPLLITLYPPVRQVSRDHPYFGIYLKAASNLEERADVPVLSGYDAFLNEIKAGADLSYSLTDGHPSCAAHALFAAWALEEWQERFPLRSLSRLDGG